LISTFNPETPALLLLLLVCTGVFCVVLEGLVWVGVCVLEVDEGETVDGLKEEDDRSLS